MEFMREVEDEPFYSLRDTFRFLTTEANLATPLRESLDIPLRAINTLGPDLTSSHLTAKFLLQGVESKPEIILHDTFEEILKIAGQMPSNELAIVPSAFRGVDAFFMSENCDFLGCFFHPTPPYHFAWNPGQDPFKDESHIKIATHPAPIGMIHRLLKLRRNWELVETTSTVAAANKVLSGECQVAFCNYTTAVHLGLVVSKYGEPIKMPWNLFLMKVAEDRSWNNSKIIGNGTRNEPIHRA